MSDVKLKPEWKTVPAVVPVLGLVRLVLVDDDVVLLPLHAEAQDVRVDLHQLMPQLHLLPEAGHHLVTELSQLLGLLLRRLVVGAAPSSSVATSIHNFLLQPSDLRSELRDYVLVL